ncbi:MAG: PAS domain-containing sensor histidine kinase [Micavibrio sp.]|nr:PAS domain-containing sensor histidine kinase [Micavibrio sp.]|tara:strand:- start:3249 stop:5894 length:2646 start_codon:yes stop_codon:yes gene_type:complete
MEKTESGMNVALEEPEKAGRLGSSSAAQIIILVNGVILTLVVFAFMSIFTEEIIRDEQNYVANQTIQNFLNTTQRVEAVVNQSATMASLGASASVIKKELMQAPFVELNFQGILIVRTQQQGWTYDLAYKGGGKDFDRIYNTLKNKDVLVNRVEMHQNDKKINADRLFSYTTFLNNNGEKQYLTFLVRSFDDGKGYAFGLLSIAQGFEAAFKDTSEYLDVVSIKNMNMPGARWDFDVDGHAQSGDDYEVQKFLVDVWQTPLEISVGFNSAHKLYFLKHLPLFFGLVGFFLTIAAAYYIRNSRIQSQRLSEMNSELENKNLELRSEITERERLNNALRQSEKENRSIIDAVSDIIFETNIEGEILFLSASWRKVTGFDPDQFIGHELFSLLHPQDQKQQQRDFELLIKGQKQAYRLFTRLRTSDGTFRAVEIAMSMIRQDQNKNLRVVGTFTDVEERRRAERALAEAEKKYRTIVENAAGGIYQLTPEGIYLSANPAMARVLGFDSPEQILREVKNAYNTIYADEKVWQEVKSSLGDNAEFYNHEVEVVRKDGRTIWVNENIRAVKDDNGNILYFEGSIEDITQRKESEIGLLEAKMNSDLANRAKSEFLANMSHELRTPLNSIIGFSEIIKNEVLGPVEQKSYWEYAKHINESGQSLLRVINEILDISRIEAGDRVLNEGRVDIEQVMSESLEMLSLKIENNQMHIVNSLHNVPKVIGEELAIKQIFMNLLSNAIKFTPSGGRITLSYEVDPHGELHLLVTDTGIGLDDHEIEKALSAFGQIDSEMNRSGSGTGLGLTLVNALIKMHGGRLDLFSQKGLGTTASITFPVERISVNKDDTDEVASDAPAKPVTSSEAITESSQWGDDVHDEVDVNNRSVDGA